MRRSQGIVLVMVSGVLTLLIAVAFAMSASASHLLLRASGAADRMNARLLARSGVEYSSARLAQDALPSRGSVVEDQQDDWTCRDGYAPLDSAANPSYAQGEPYLDFTRNGRYDPRGDGYTDLNQNGRFDAWSGRLRGRSGLASSVFLLRVAGAKGGISVNGGILGPRSRDLDAPGACGGSLPNRRLAGILNHLGGILGISETLGDLIVRKRPVSGYDSLDELGRVLIFSGLSASDWAALRPNVTVGRDSDPGTYTEETAVDPVTKLPYRTGKLFREPRIAMNVNSAGVPALAALQEGVSGPLATYAYVYEGLATPRTIGLSDPSDPGNKMKQAVIVIPAVSGGAQRVRITRRDALNVGNFLVGGRPFAGRFDLFRRLDAQKGNVFMDAYDSQDEVSFGLPVANPNIFGAQPEPKAGYPVPALLARNQFVNLVTENANPVRSGEWPAAPYGNPARAARGPYSFLTYDVSRWQWSDGDDRLPRSPGPDQGETAELELEPEGSFHVESLGRVGAGRELLARKRIAATVHPVERLRERSQADFENLEGSRAMAGGIRLSGDPAKDHIQSSPLASLRSLRDFQPGAGPGAQNPDYRFHDFIGDLRLMDYSDPAMGSPFLYLPFWEVEQPYRTDRAPTFAGLLGSAGSAAARSYDAAVPAALAAWKQKTLTAFQQGARQAPGRCGGHLYRWGAPGAPAENAGDMPWSRGGTVPRGGVEFWTDGSACAFDNPAFLRMGPHPTAAAFPLPGLILPDYFGTTPAASFAPQVTSIPIKTPMVLGWLQTVSQPGGGGSTVIYTENLQSARAFQQGEWHPVAFAFDAEGGGDGAVRGYLDGIPVLSGTYRAGAIDAAHPQTLQAGVDFLTPLAGPAGVDELRLYDDPASAEVAAIPHALQPRFWPQGECRSPLHLFPRPAQVDGARWDGFVPRSLASPAAGSAGAPLRAWLQLYSDASGEGLVQEKELNSSGLWTAVPAAGIRSYRYRIRIDAEAAEPLRDTPVFEGITVGYHAGRRMVEWAEDVEDPLAPPPPIPAPLPEPPSTTGFTKNAPIQLPDYGTITKDPEEFVPKDLPGGVSGPKLPK